MANWYVAPDGTTTPGVTLVAIGTTNYGKSWATAAKWSDFNNGGGSIWASKVASGDTINFLAGPYPLNAASGGWTNLNNSMANLTLQGVTVDGRLGYATFTGTRTSPWPVAGDAGATVGETFMKLLTGHVSTTLIGIRARNLGYFVTPGSNGTTPNLGTITMTDCSSRNTIAGLFTVSTKTDGMIAIVGTRLKCHGYARAGLRTWGPITLTDFVLDSEFQATAASRGSAAQVSGAHVMDSLPGFASTVWPMVLLNGLARNHAAGSSGGGYSQGDGIIAEENAGNVTARKILTYGNGDRGLDMKCAGQGQTVVSWGDGTSGVAHHMDTSPYVGVHHLLKVGARPAGANNPQACAQASGIMQLIQSAMVCKPTAAQVANNPYGVTTGSVDISKFQSSIYGSLHQGLMQLIDTWGVYAGTNGATEQNGYAGNADNARTAAVFGLTPGSSYNFAVRACAQDGSVSALSSAVAFTMDSAGTGDNTGPAAAPTGLSVTGTTSSTVTMSWNQVAADSGTEIQGYIFEMSTDGGTTWVPVFPGKTNTPVTYSGLKPATSYKFRVAAYDCNGNVGTRSGSVTATTSAGTADTNTPSAPTSPVVAAGWLSHPTMAGLAWSAPASGTVAYYEVVNTSGGAVVGRCLPIPGSSTLPVYSKTNARLTSV